MGRWEKMKDERVKVLARMFSIISVLCEWLDSVMYIELLQNKK